MKRFSLLVVLFVATLALTFSASWREAVAPSTQAQANSLSQRLSATIAKDRIGSRGVAAALVLDLKTGKTLYSYNADTPMVPASNMKVLTTAAAFSELGTDFSLKTQLFRRGEIEDGVLEGDLLLKGFGDPNISGRFNDGDVTEVLRKFALVLRRKGIREVKGKLYYDASYFSGEAVHADWPKDQFNKWYEAEPSALSLNDNCITVQIDATEGATAKLTKIPATGYVSLSGSIDSKSGNRDPKVAVVRPNRENNELKVWGDIYRGRPTFTAECTVHDPAAFFAQVMLETCQERGVAIAGGREAKSTSDAEREKDWTLTAEFASDMATTLFVCNQNSQNLYAENLFRILGAEKAAAGTYEGGRKAVLAFLKKEKIASDGAVLSDGSGLADSNRLTATLLAKVLRSMALKEDGDVFKGTFPVAGESGTLEKRLRGADTKGRVFAKTGYISGVYSLSGYLDAKSGQRYVFSVILNSSVSRSPVDKFVEALAD